MHPTTKIPSSHMLLQGLLSSKVLLSSVLEELLPYSLSNEYVYLLSSYRLTVRTLDFHSNNVGSIPSNLSFMQLKNVCKYLSLKKNNNPKIKYSNSLIKYTFHFTSLITPHKINNVRLLNSSINSNISKKHKKIFTKQSYLLMT